MRCDSWARPGLMAAMPASMWLIRVGGGRISAEERWEQAQDEDSAMSCHWACSRIEVS